MAQLIWSPRAARDFFDICEYIGRDSKRAARKFGRQLLRVMESIPQQPGLGATVPEHERDDIRERILGDYRIDSMDLHANLPQECRSSPE